MNSFPERLTRRRESSNADDAACDECVRSAVTPDASFAGEVIERHLWMPFFSRTISCPISQKINAMKIMSRLIAVILFIFFFFFALRNMQEITLHFLFGYERTDPLVLVLLVCFIGGAMFGVLAMTPIVFHHRREASRHKQTIAVLKKEREAHSVESSQHLV